MGFGRSIDTTNASIRYEWLTVGERRVLHGMATAGNQNADFTFDGRTIQFGDGYRIVRTTFNNDSARLVMMLTAWAPSGAFEAAVIQYDRGQRKAVATSFGPMSALLARSHDARLVSAVFAAESASNTRTVSDACTSAASGFMAATLGAVAGCATVPKGCLIFLLAEASAYDSVVSSCPYEYGDTSGWG